MEDNVAEAQAPTAIVVIEPEDLDYARELAEAHGVRMEEMSVRGIEPVLTVTLVLFGAALAVGTVVYLLDKAKGGQVIDLRESMQKKFYRTDDVAYGLVVIITADGKVTVEVKEPRGLFGEVIDALTKVTVDLGKAGLDVVAHTAKGAVGDKGNVKVEPVPTAA
jgi:hypothetical protein